MSTEAFKKSPVKVPEINILTVSGKIVRNPELRNIKDGQSVCAFRMCATRSPRTGTGGKPKYTFFKVKCWNEIANYVATYMEEKDPVVVMGRLELDEWTDKDGNKKSELYVKADKVSSLIWKENAVRDINAISDKESEPAAKDDYTPDDDDIPL